MERLTGWKRRVWTHAAFGVLTVITGGLVWIVVYLFPQTMLWLLQECSLEEAQYVLAKLKDKRCVLSKVLRIALSTKQGVSTQSEMKLIKLLLATYVYDAPLGTFILLPDLPSGVPIQLHLATAALDAIDRGAEWSTLNPLHTWPRRARAMLYGDNDMSAGRPKIASMVYEGLTHPVYLVQYLELAFTMYEGYYYYAGVLLATTLISGFMSTRVVRKKRLQLYNSVAQRRVVPLVQHGRVSSFVYSRGVSSHRLVPGDIVVVTRGKATCDMVLLQGNCLVEESMLSGEAAQVRKVSYIPTSDQQSVMSSSYHPDTHQSCSIFAGTYVQQVWNEKAPEEEVLALVVRTGLHTNMGSMLRQVLTPVIGTDPFVKDLYSFCSFVLVLQLAIFSLYIAKAKVHHQRTSDVVRNVLDTLVAAVPIGIPAVIIYSMWRCVVALRHNDIEMHRAAKIKTAAAVEVVVLDKTGTLTDNLPGLLGMLPVAHGKFTTLQPSPMNWPNSLKQCAAICNSLNLVNQQRVVGDTADYTAFKACEARFLDRNVVALPLKHANDKSATQTTLQLLKRFEFESQLLRSGVLAADSAAPEDEAVYFVRGAPAAIEDLVGRAQVPLDYRQVIDDYSGQSFRLLALARGFVRGADRQNLSRLNQEQLEKQVAEFEVLGLLVLSNHLRPDSKDTITQLQQHAGLRTLMATGDYHYTALAVARGVGMIPRQGKVIIIQKEVEARPADQNILTQADKAVCPSHLNSKAGSVAPKPSSFRSVPGKATQTGSLAHQVTHSVSFATGLAAARGQEQEELLERHIVQDTLGTMHLQSQHQTSDGGLAYIPQEPCSISFTRSRHAGSSSEYQGLLFQVDNGSAAQDDALQALTSIAQGEAQCCVTGAAFEHMLQLGDQSLLETVMRSVVVFSRMKSRQKGQVVDLLGSTGLHQTIDGQQHYLPGLGKTCLYCGDGINDLIALAGADVGVSVGASDAAAAAVFSTKRFSIAGVASVLQVIYMVLYQLILSFAFKVSFFIDGSRPSNRQRAVLDVMALSLGFVCSLRPSRSRLYPCWPEQFLCMRKHFIILSVEIAMLGSVYAVFPWFMSIQPWYTGGNGTSQQNVVVTTCWMMALCQVYGVPALTFQSDTRNFCKRFSLPEFALIMIFCVICTVAGLYGAAAMDTRNYFGFYKYPWDFRWKTNVMAWAYVLVFSMVLVPMRQLLEQHKRGRQVMPSLSTVPMQV